MKDFSKPVSLEFEILSFPNGSMIPGEFTLCIQSEEEHVAFGGNKNPHLEWANAPDGTKSFAILMIDPDAPSSAEDVNQEGKSVSADLPRVDFYHWVLVDIPPDRTELPEGLDSSGVTPGGKEIGPTDYGVRGQNDFTDWFAGNEEMEGVYGGYDGPCAPWNDELLHHYYFRLYALDVPSLGLSGAFGGDTVIEAMEGHILDAAEWMGTHSLNPDITG